MTEAICNLPPEWNRIKDRRGQRAGRLTLIKPIRRFKSGKAWRIIWSAKCDCGNMAEIHSGHVGHRTSCGCLRDEHGSKLCLARNFKHGYAYRGRRHPCYNVWAKMIRRCENPAEVQYQDYGGRGISVSERWRQSFTEFLKDMGERPSLKHQIDRIDNNKGYFKENCRWITASRNCRNKRNNRLITMNGITRCLSDWCDKFGIAVKTVDSRLRKGWDFERAFKTPKLR